MQAFGRALIPRTAVLGRRVQAHAQQASTSADARGARESAAARDPGSRVPKAAAILATPYGSLPESRSLWPAAVSPSAAGLFGSDRVNIDVLRQGGTAASSPLASISLPVGNAFLGPYDDDGQIRDEAEADAEDDDEEDDDEEGGVESDEVMFEMSINGDDGQSTSGASTAETTSGKASAGSGDEKDSGYASAPRQVPLKPSAGAAAATSPPVGFFDTRARSVALSRSSSSAMSPPVLVGSNGSSASSITPTTKAHLPPPRIVPSSTSPMLNPVALSSSLGPVKPPLRPSERSFLVQNPYAASDVRATLASRDQRDRSSAAAGRRVEGDADEDEDMAEEGPARWPSTADEVVDMEL